MEHIDYNLLYHTNPNDFNGLFRIYFKQKFVYIKFL